MRVDLNPLNPFFNFIKLSPGSFPHLPGPIFYLKYLLRFFQLIYSCQPYLLFTQEGLSLAFSFTRFTCLFF